MHYIYILLCQDDSFYTGYTNQISHRFLIHCQKKGAKYTKAHPPVALVHIECFDDKSSALQREHEIKQLSKADKLSLQTMFVTIDALLAVQHLQNDISRLLLAWYDTHKRDLPWRKDQNPYFIWISEVMSQQTRIATVIPYFKRFTERFPTVASLAAASENEVLKYWEGLGYYSRARNLHKAAKQIVEQYNTQFPATYTAWKELSGVGDYTASAVASIAFGEPIGAVDGNALRVVSRILSCGEDISAPATKQMISRWLNRHIDKARPGDFNQSIMDLGATVCTPTSPQCSLCPIQKACLSNLFSLQEILPFKTRSSKQSVISRAVILLENEQGQWLVRQRTERLLHNLWEFPALECDDIPPKQALETLLEEWGITYTKNQIKPIGHAIHIFSHIRWEMDGFYMKLRDIQTKSIPALWQNTQWCSKDIFVKEAWPTALQYYKSWAQNTHKKR